MSIARHAGAVTEANIDPDSDITPAAEHGEYDDPVGDEPTRWLRIDRTTLIVIIALGIGIFALVRGLLVGITGDERAGLPPNIEEVQPVPEAVQVLNQSNVFVDLATGYTGVLIIDGIELDTVDLANLGELEVEPGQQRELPDVTIYEGGNSTLTFTPNSSAPISQFVDGEHTIELLYWRSDETRRQARSYTWTFTVV